MHKIVHQNHHHENFSIPVGYSIGSIGYVLKCGMPILQRMTAIIDFLQTSFREDFIERSVRGFPSESLFLVSIHLEPTEQSKGFR